MAGEGGCFGCGLTVYFAQWLVQWMVQWLAREEQMHVGAISSPRTEVGLGGWSRGGKRCCATQALSVFSCITFYCTFVHHRVCLEHLLLWFEFTRAQATTRGLLDTFHMTVTLRGANQSSFCVSKAGEASF